MDVPIEEVDEAAVSETDVASDDKIGDENEEPSRSVIVEEENESDLSSFSETYEPTCYLNDISDSESEESISDNNKISDNPLLVGDDGPEIDC